MRFLKPIDTSILEKAAASKYGILTVEEGTIKGGLFGEVAERMVSESVNISIKGIGIPDKFVTQDRQSAQRKEYGLDEEGIFDVLTKMCKKLQKVLENKN